MKFAIIQFPGSNCDLDMLWALKDVLKEDAAYVWHAETSLAGYDAVMLPGGFSYGDYLRTGSIAKFSNIMPEVIRFAKEGKTVVGICNGFQILTECGLLPGALIRNSGLSFVCKPTPLRIVNNNTRFTNLYEKDEIIDVPIAHGEGNYYCTDEDLKSLKDNNQIVFTYEDNPNGSLANIAGIMNKEGNVFGMMPHPERVVEKVLGSDAGLRFFQSIVKAWR